MTRGSMPSQAPSETQSLRSSTTLSTVQTTSPLHPDPDMASDSDSHSHSSRDPSHIPPPISFSFTEAMDDVPEPSPMRVSFNENKPAPNASKRASLYAAQDTVSSPSPAPPTGARYSTLSPEMAERPRMSSAEGFKNPFGFQTQTYTAGKQPVRNTSVCAASIVTLFENIPMLKPSLSKN